MVISLSTLGLRVMIRGSGVPHICSLMGFVTVREVLLAGIVSAYQRRLYAVYKVHSHSMRDGSPDLVPQLLLTSLCSLVLKYHFLRNVKRYGKF